MLSFADELRANVEAVRATVAKDLPVAPRQVLVVRFRPPKDPDSLIPVIAAYKANGALPLEQQKQLVIDCHDEILRTVDGEPYEDGSRPGKPRSELEQFEGGPLRFDASDERWAAKAQTARDCVAELYNLDNLPGALAGLADALIDWLQGVDAAILARAEGKSSASGEETSSTQPDSTSKDSTASDTSA